MGSAEAREVAVEKAVLAGGCFWGVEKVFADLPGVVSTRVGYTGGAVKNPTYEAVCSGRTGHAEAIEVTFDPSKTSYEDMLVNFFKYHDPTTLNRQGPDIGTQYRSAIFYHSPAQKAAAERAARLLEEARVFKGKIVTEIAPAGEFYAAEDYHQKYLKKNPGGYCSIQLQSKKISQALRATS
ncbi:MAG: peptide-methionine (S)-S-oxide reductase MsrA [Candidatus Omnitrophica bacterium]|nr:peptide-methionine (S)-S-oxide reductase MsrA [Candidatus Omnitrophota bacterium]